MNQSQLQEIRAQLSNDPSALRLWKEFVFSQMRVETAPGVFEQYRPQDYQAAIHYSFDWRCWSACWGRRSGKTLGAAAEAIQELGLPNRRIWVVAPDHSLTDKVFREVYLQVVSRQIYGPGSVVKAYNTDNKRQIVMASGAWIEGKTAKNPNSLVGEGLDLIIIDEAAKVPPLVWEMYLEPTTLNRAGRVLFISTPQGWNWFKVVYDRGNAESTYKKGWRSSHVMTAESRYISQELLNAMRGEVPDTVWRQEYEARFEHHTGLVWPEYRDMLYNPEYPGRGGQLYDPQEVEIRPTWTFYRAIDVGWRHPTACLWFAVSPENDAYFYRHYNRPGKSDGLTAEDHAKQISALSSEPVFMTYMSPDAKKQNPLTKEDRYTNQWQVYRDQGILGRLAANDVKAGCDRVAMYLKATLQDRPQHSRAFINKDLYDFRESIQRYVMDDPIRMGEVDPPERPKKKNDDDVDAFRYGLASGPRYVPKWQMEVNTPPDEMVMEEGSPEWSRRYGLTNIRRRRAGRRQRYNPHGGYGGV